MWCHSLHYIRLSFTNRYTLILLLALRKQLCCELQSKPHGTELLAASRRSTPRHVVIKKVKSSNEEWVLKAAREKTTSTYKENSISLSVNFSAETLRARREWHDIFSDDRKNNNNRIRYLEYTCHQNTLSRKAIIQNRRRDSFSDK